MNSNHHKLAPGRYFLKSAGTLCSLIDRLDWANTPLGPIEQWSHVLKTSISIILNSHHPMFIAWGPEQIFIYNDAYIQVLSLAKHPWALGRSFSEVWAEIWDTCGPLTEKVFQQSQSSFVDNVCLFMQRQTYLEETYFSFSYSPILDESGSVSGLFCASAETTDKLLNERRLKTLNELSANTLLETSIESACITTITTLAKNVADIPFALLYLVDKEGKTAVREQVTGIQENMDLVCPPILDLKKDIKKQGIWPIIQVVKTGEAKIITVAPKLLPLGLANQPIVEVMLLPVTSLSQDSPTGILILGVNPCRRLDTEYITFFNLIAGQIATVIKKARLFEEEKQRAEKLAEIDRAKTQFFSNISHEFRTPLTLMLGPLEDLLADVHVNASHRNNLELLHRNTRRLLKLVNSLLDFSRIEAGRMRASYQPTNLAMLTADIASVFRAAIEKVGLEFNVNTPAIEDEVYVDHEMWEKIVLNLLSNAFKFTLQGKIELNLFKKDKTLHLEIKDTGIGIPKNELPKIFERFHRVENSQGRTYEGTGIGLALIQELVKLHGGSITVESEAGKGSSFYVTIPLGYAHLPADKIINDQALLLRKDLSSTAIEEVTQWLSTQKIHSEFSEQQQLQLKNAHILLADDNADMRNYVKNLLSSHWQVTAVTDGQECYEAAVKNPPNLILSDVMMPNLDGFGLIQKLRANSKTKHIPIILLSARAGEESRIEGLQIGADDYLVKPFSAKELLARVQTHLELGRLRTEASLEREKMFAVFTQAPVAICVLEGPKLIFTLANSKYMEFFEEGKILIGKPIDEALGELKSQGILEILDNVYKTGTPYVANERQVYLAQPGGSLKEVYFDFVYQPIRKAEGNISGIVTVCTDVTIKVLARKRVEAAEQRLKIALTSAQMGAWDYDAVTKKIYWDDAARELLGLNNNDLMEKPSVIFRRVLHPDDRRQALQVFKDAVSQNEDISLEYRVVWPDKSIHWIQFAGKVVKNNLGLLQRLIGTVVETTAKKNAEQALKNAISVRDEFLSVASHELKTPVTSLKLQIQLSQRKIEHSNNVVNTVSLSNSFAMSLRQVDRLTTLIDDLLDVSRIQAGKLVFHFEPTALYELTNDIIERYSSEFKLHNITVHTDFPEEIIGIWDRSRIEQVIVNLLSNIIKYVPGKPVHISARRNGEVVEYIVKDSGVGIPKNKQNLIFQRFERASSDNSGGLGLGLFIVKKIIENHQGSISVESEEGQGASFIVRLPIDSNLKSEAIC